MRQIVVNLQLNKLRGGGDDVTHVYSEPNR